MAAVLKGAAANSVNKGHPSSYYSNDRANPVIQKLEDDLKLFTGYMKKRCLPGFDKPADEPASRPYDTLFDLWNKYESKLPKQLYQKKLLDMGDFLVSIKEYNLAQWQCYERYLKSSRDFNVEEITDVEAFKASFFPTGFDTEDARFTFQSLLGKCICNYQAIKSADPKLQNTESVEKSVAILNFLRLIMQVVMPKESLCWLVFNGTVHIYNISRHLMALGHSAKVLEYLLWSAMCMEGSVPLLGVKYLSWRTTLYTAVCQCYYDCNAGQHAEGFARRALSKINELSQLEGLSSAPETPSVELVFREASVKMAIMIYKRTVFETRRKPKGLLRPKTRTNLKEAALLPWPRTQSEKLLAAMLEGSSAQMLCILETLTDPCRRTLLSSAPASDADVEILDVFAEVFMAAQELLAGGGGSHATDKVGGATGGIVSERPLVEMAARGEEGVPLSAVFKLIKLAYCYEQWDVLDSLIQVAHAVTKELDDPRYRSDVKMLELLQAYDKVVPRLKHRKLYQNTDEAEETLTEAQTVTVGGQVGSTEDHLLKLGEVLVSIFHGPYKPDDLDLDMVVDASLLLWSKCKGIFARYQTGSTDNVKYLQRMDNSRKWVLLLDALHQGLGWCGLSNVDPALCAEVVLRLSLVHEASATLLAATEVKGHTDRHKMDASAGRRDQDEDVSIMSSHKDPSGHMTSASEVEPQREQSRPITSQHSFTQPSVSYHLLKARTVLEQGLRNVSMARQTVARSDGRSIADVSWSKELNPTVKQAQRKPSSRNSAREPLPVEPTDGEEDSVTEERDIRAVDQTDATAVWNMIKDLHLELIFVYHRVCVKLAQKGPEPVRESKEFVRKTCSRLSLVISGRPCDNYVESITDLEANCNRHHVTRALFSVQRALLENSADRRKLVEEAMSDIKKAEVDERRTFLDNRVTEDEAGSTEVTRSRTPPAPLLLCRTDTKMVFKPAPFAPESGQKVAWYRLFARNAAGSNVKARLNDNVLPGTGQQVPAFRCELQLGGLTPGQKYVCAVAAYTSDGQLIGGSIGDGTRPILASHPLPVLMAWAYLSQVAYQIGCYDVAKEACSILWNHFVATPQPPERTSYVTSSGSDFKLTLHRLNDQTVSQTSPVLLRHFLSSIFMDVDTVVREGELFCDKLCDNGPLHKGQIRRLQQCEKLLVAMELCGWLNEASLSLQAAVQCYGLLAPLIHYKIPAIPIVQVLERCNAVLQEIPTSLLHRRTPAMTESLHHMTACLTYYMAKVLRTWGQRALSANMNETGRRLLAVDSDKDKGAAGGDCDPLLLDLGADTGSLTLAALKKKKSRKGAAPPGKDDLDGTGNEELKALEAHMLRLSKQAQSEHELTGNEDPSILHAYIAYLPSRVAYKEVVRFKRRARYLEFLVQTAQKALAEGIPEAAMEWCEDALAWLQKRNEGIIGTKATVGKQPGATTIIGDDPKKFAAALVEYSKSPRSPRRCHTFDFSDEDDDGENPDQSPRDKGKTKGVVKPKSKKSKYKAIGINPNMTEEQQQQQEVLELKALEILMLYFLDMYQARNKRRKLRKISTDEMPWRAQFNIVLGLSQFGVFLSRLDAMEKQTGISSANLYNSSCMDDEWFSLSTAGTLVVAWPGGPSRQHTRQRAELTRTDSGAEPRETAIEMAAAAATGKPPVAKQATPEEDEDTPRTYRSEVETQRNMARNKGKKTKEGTPETDPGISPKEALGMIQKTFQSYEKAVVLAHRGRHWTLLQNACRALWNCATTAVMRLGQPDSATGAALMDGPGLRAVMWRPLHTAADCLLDMLVQLQRGGKMAASSEREQGGDPDHVITSCVGGIGHERGGASLRFESPLDDLSHVDTRWLRRLVLRSMELLCYEKKWEHLADVALRFNALTDDRYSEQVTPLLVQAQRKLIKRVSENDGKLPPQPHFEAAMATIGRPITSKDYATLQLRVQLDDEILSRIDPGAQIDPEGHDLYSGGVHALRQCSVPLDVAFTLHNFRSVLDASSYTSRALQHSRRLLVLYLAGQNAGGHDDAAVTGVTSKVDFAPNTAKPQPNMPPDLQDETFRSLDDIQTSPLPKSQIALVVTSYEKTIDMLLASNHKGLAAEAMKELGNIHYHSQNIRGAYKWWAESLDLVIGTLDAIHQWRVALDGEKDISHALLEKCGLWGCLLGGILSSNIAQYILTSDLGLRTECCFLSTYFFKALFRASLPHPTSDRDYASYEVGEGCEVTYLVPGIDLLSDRFRLEGRTLVAALRFVMEELARGRHGLFVLPLMTLHQYFTTFMCRDLQRSVDGRILKVAVLTDLGLFTEAVVTLLRLLNGERLPHSADSNFRQVAGRTGSLTFNTSKPLLEPGNLKVMEVLVEKRLSSDLSALYGPHLTCQLSIAHAHLLTTLAQTIPGLPQFENIPPPGSAVLVQTPPAAALSDTKARGTSKVSSVVSARGGSVMGSRAGELKRQGDKDAESGRASGGDKYFTGTATMETIKGTLLATADQMVSSLSGILLENGHKDKGPEGMSAAELEIVLLCKLEMAAIARQRHHAALAARVVMSALRLLQNSDVFRQRRDMAVHTRVSSMRMERRQQGLTSRREASPAKSDRSGGTGPASHQDFLSRSRLDARMWLKCRLALVEAMAEEVRGMGEIKGLERGVKPELADVRQYCAEGVAEAEACGDSELQAEFLLQAVLLNVCDGRHVDDTTQLLQDILALLNRDRQISTSAQLLVVIALVTLTDLDVVTSGPESQRDSLADTARAYNTAQELLLRQLEDLGEEIDHRLDGRLEHDRPVAPLRNLYLPQLALLVQTKLRLGHVVARKTAKSTENRSTEEAAKMWSEPLGVLSTAWEMSKVMTGRNLSAEAEILLHMGKVQRQLMQLGHYDMRAAAETFVEAIKTSFANDHDLSLIRQCYLELAILYLAGGGAVKVKDGSIVESLPAPTVSDDAMRVESAKSRKKQYKNRKGQASREKLVRGGEGSQEAERKAAWTALRCAAAVGQAQRARVLLVGDHNVTAQPLGDKIKDVVPEFLVLDLVGSYVLGERKRVYKNEIEEEMAPLTELLEPPPVETYQDQLNRAKETAKDLSWIHVLGYQAILQRLSSPSTVVTNTTTNTAETDDDIPDGVEDLTLKFDLGVVDRSRFSVTPNHDVSRYLLLSSMWVTRLSSLHQFMTQRLPSYANECSAIYPPADLQLPVSSEVKVTDLDLIMGSYSGNLMDASEDDGDDPGSTTSPAQSVTGRIQKKEKPVSARKEDKAVISPSGSEITIQWYDPALEARHLVAKASDGKAEAEKMIMLLYAMNDAKSDRKWTSMMWVPLVKVIGLHDKLTVLTQRGEISLMGKIEEKPKRETPAPPAQGQGRAKKQTRIKALSAKVKRDELLEALLRQCVADAQAMVGYLPPTAEPEEGDGAQPALLPGDLNETGQSQPVTPKPIADKAAEQKVDATDEAKPPEIAFDITLANLHHMEKLYDPSFGHWVRDPKMLQWLRQIFPSA